jgi:hypothetical protein
MFYLIRAATRLVRSREMVAGVKAARVAEGAATLDRISPGWERRIGNLAIKIRNPQRCVLARVFGSYQGGLERVGRDPFSLGFSCYPRDERYVTKCWKYEINRRLLRAQQ